MTLLSVYKILWSVCHTTLHTRRTQQHDDPHPPIQTQNNNCQQWCSASYRYPSMLGQFCTYSIHVILHTYQIVAENKPIKNMTGTWDTFSWQKHDHALVSPLLVYHNILRRYICKLAILKEKFSKTVSINSSQMYDLEYVVQMGDQVQSNVLQCYWTEVDTFLKMWIDTGLQNGRLLFFSPHKYAT